MSFKIIGWNKDSCIKSLADTAKTKDKENQLILKHGEKKVWALDDMCGALKKMNGNNKLSSCDAFHENNGFYYYIEFKNQPVGNIDQVDVQKKALISPYICELPDFFEPK